MKTYFTFLFFLISTFTFGQKTVYDSLISQFEKEMVYEQNNILKLKNLHTIDDKFFFRLSNNKITIELNQDKNGKLSLYSYQYYFKIDKQKTIDTIINRIIYNEKIATWLYDNLKLNNFEKLFPIKNESKIGKSGIFGNDDFYFELINNDEYTIKAFSFNQLDSDLNFNSFKNLIDELFLKIEFENNQKIFKDNLKGGYLYKNIFSHSFYKIPETFTYINFISNIRLPIGLKIDFDLKKIGRKKINTNINFIIENNFKNNMRFKSSINKNKLTGNFKSYSDSFCFTYEYNQLDFIKKYSKYNNFEITYYGFIPKFFDFGIGYNKIANNLNGVNIQISKYWNKPKIDFYYKINFVENKFSNYTSGIQRQFQIKINNNFHSIYSNLYYEKIFDFNSFNFSINIPLRTLRFTLN
ncbi:Hypothetical protein precursor [Flavobacterium indicum GPTSA100-9 = DSM 17447]|uniref:Uncharacterized protein n=1 Tax=Flavobacterium indicum (strain DSM 17447 / CIP 109464 / GPTSA100-9) TaxID=1094466 RepID=H8XRL0_FLAIG|nr:hypothetical protein [Flavobacterium indicum]CCG54444.1 Hypothetical protein precursor [Flavobacterium indicum GPTSA100-9 = DSM 17447]